MTRVTFAVGILLGAVAGWYLGSRGGRAARSWRDHRIAVAGAKSMRSRRWVGARVAIVSWLVVVAVVYVALTYR